MKTDTMAATGIANSTQLDLSVSATGLLPNVLPRQGGKRRGFSDGARVQTSPSNTSIARGSENTPTGDSDSTISAEAANQKSPEKPQSAFARQMAESSRRRRVAPGCLKALAMLTKNPVTTSPLPRLRVSRLRPTGSLTVHDRSSGDQFTIYTPAFQSLLDGGHRAGRWYVRPVNSVGADPVSLGFTTAKRAVEALSLGQWRVNEPRPRASAMTNPACRVIWQ